MAVELWLVRHGQAAFATGDYDRLTDLGWQQSRWLGEHLADMEQELVARGILPVLLSGEFGQAGENLALSNEETSQIREQLGIPSNDIFSVLLSADLKPRISRRGVVDMTLMLELFDRLPEGQQLRISEIGTIGP